MTGIISPPGAHAVAASLTVADLFREQVRARGDAIALEHEGRQWSYAELGRRVDGLVCFLALNGIGRGDRLAVLSENRNEYLEIVLATAHLGAIVACLNWRLASAELDSCVRLAGPALALVSERHASAFAAINHSGIPCLVFGEAYESHAAANCAAAAPCLAEPEDGLTLLNTSGTTGRAKAALISHRALIARAAISVADGILVPGLAFVAWAPFFHIGANDSSLATLMQGGKVIVIDGFKPEAIAKAVCENRIGWLSLAGTVGRMIAELARHEIPAGQVRLVGSMADLVPREDIAAITQALQAPFLNSFASTETGMAPASGGKLPIGALPDKFLKRQSALCRIRLLDEDGQEAPIGKPGVLSMRGPSLFSGYFGDPAATAAAFRDGWYHMGDQFIRHSGGELEYVGREKYLIKSGGENIYPAEIEQLVLASTRIEEAVLVGRPDKEWGEIPVLLVVKRDRTLDHGEVAALYQGKIARYKYPKEIIFVENDFFQRSSTGKVMRSEIRLA